MKKHEDLICERKDDLICCAICKGEFKSFIGLTNHLKLKKKMSVCGGCEEQLSFNCELKSHITLHAEIDQVRFVMILSFLAFPFSLAHKYSCRLTVN